ncbi:hypothetical protein BpHYR1_050400 [Brachionus plicatilis]|uniref:Uncharacterized protein n=1 Tax=Brachionus plicatilis TaxID=10195 RepID=A0A3M7SCL6_BRAPC|nr:hypothetical protein BpHYR1_050400 [Brachionus plicatilis]
MASFGFENVPFFNGEGDAENFIQYYKLEAVKKYWNDAKKFKHLIEKYSKPTDICIKEFQERIMKADESPAQLAIEFVSLNFLKCLAVHVRSVVRGGMSKFDWSEVVSLADQVFKDYIPNGQGVELETKIEVEGELNSINVSDSKRCDKFNGNCNFCGIYGQIEVECRKKRERMSVTNNNDSRFNFNNYNNDRSKTFSRKHSDKSESFNTKAYTVQLNNTQKELD